MLYYRRAWFFTVNLLGHHGNDLLVRHVDLLRQAASVARKERSVLGSPGPRPPRRLATGLRPFRDNIRAWLTIAVAVLRVEHFSLQSI